jgi:hypothetical protein
MHHPSKKRMPAQRLKTCNPFPLHDPSPVLRLLIYTHAISAHLASIDSSIDELQHVSWKYWHYHLGVPALLDTTRTIAPESHGILQRIAAERRRHAKIRSEKLRGEMREKLLMRERFLMREEALGNYDFGLCKSRRVKSAERCERLERLAVLV